jgi:hypothetical protein
VHPGVVFTKTDLDAIKADLNKEPWKSAYSRLTADYRSALDYQMKGPFAEVSRNPHINRDAWVIDMAAAYNMARLWYFTGNEQYAQKGHDILLAWARTQTSFGGAESAFDIGGCMCAAAADILRGTWPGWTSSDTATVQKFFANVLWPSVSAPGPLMTGSQGMEQISGSLAIAIFNDDRAKFNQVLSSFLTDANTGLRGSLSNGQVVDTGRDQGHTSLYVELVGRIGQMFWNQGVDVFSVMDNRILAIGEYYARYSVGDTTPAYVPFGGQAWGVFSSMPGDPPSMQPRTALNALRSAYAVRKGLSTPWIDRYLPDQAEDIDSFMFRRSSDTSTAPVATIPVLPQTSLLTTGLTTVDLNGATPAGTGSYADRTWTLKGGYNGQPPYSATPTMHFDYKAITGDFTMVAKVESVSNAGNVDGQAGIMIRDAATAMTSSQTYIAVTTDTRGSWSERGAAAVAYVGFTGNTFPLPTIPYWIKMERVGNRVQTFTSPDGASWAGANSNDFPDMPSMAYVGLFASSSVAGQAITAKFTNVAITGGDGGAAVLAPTAPYSVTASPAEEAVVLRWNEAHGASTYNVLRSTSSGGAFSQIATVSGTTYTDRSVTSGTRYYYAVTASNATGTSGPSPLDSATPDRPLASVAFGGTASTSNAFWDGQASYAFDTNPGSQWHVNPSGSLPQWLQYDFGQGVAQTVLRYGVTSSWNTPTRNPSAWQMQGSQNGADWVLLDSRSAQTFARKFQTRYYDIPNTTSYRYYRLNVTAGADQTDVEVSEFSLFAAPSRN